MNPASVVMLIVAAIFVALVAMTDRAIDRAVAAAGALLMVSVVIFVEVVWRLH